MPSTRAPKGATAEIVLALSEWEAQALAIQLKANEQRRARTTANGDSADSDVMRL
jgi:hypothetical protein